MEGIHIGSIIQHYMEDRGISPSWLAQQINCNRTNIYKIYKKKHIDTELLIMISNALNYNFFKEYIKENIILN